MKNQYSLNYTCTDESMMLLIEAILENIRHKLNLAYWNNHQKEMASPFDNTSARYENNTFSVSAYDWSDKENKKPNFQYKSFKVYWYKYLGREMEVFCNEPITADYIKTMHLDCINAINADREI